MFSTLVGATQGPISPYYSKANQYATYADFALFLGLVVAGALTATNTYNVLSHTGAILALPAGAIGLIILAVKNVKSTASYTYNANFVPEIK